MKIGGRVVDGPKMTTLVLPREDGDIIFKFIGVSDDKEFDKIIQQPQPPVSFNVKLQQNVAKYEDKGYKEKLKRYFQLNNAWVFLESIKPSEIVWDTVKADEPDTWLNWQDDLKKAGFTLNEVNAIWTAFQKCNMLTDEMLDEARSRFLASLEAAKLSPLPLSPSGESQSTPTGEPQNASA